MSESKSWSLQGDKRTEKERNLFKPNGKSPKNNTAIYVFSLVGVFLLISFLMTFFSEKELEACVTQSFCFNSKDNILLYTFYVFFNIVIVVLAVFGAYIIGKKLGNMLKK